MSEAVKTKSRLSDVASWRPRSDGQRMGVLVALAIGGGLLITLLVRLAF